MTENQAILDLIMRDIACDNSIEHLNEQADAIHQKRTEVLKAREDIRKTLLGLMKTTGIYSFLLPTGKIAVVECKPSYCNVTIQDITKL